MRANRQTNPAKPKGAQASSNRPTVDMTKGRAKGRALQKPNVLTQNFDQKGVERTNMHQGDVAYEANELADALIRDAILESSRVSDDCASGDEDNLDWDISYAEGVHCGEWEKVDSDAELELPSALEVTDDGDSLQLEENQQSPLTVAPGEQENTHQDEEASPIQADPSSPTSDALCEQLEDETDALSTDSPTPEVGRAMSEDDDQLPALPNFGEDRRRNAAHSPTDPDAEWECLTSPSSDGTRLPTISSRGGSSRPLTSFIDAEVAEIMAARTQRQHQDHLQAETMAFGDCPKPRKQKAAPLKPIRSKQREPVVGPDGKFTRAWLTAEEMDQLEKEADALRKELQELDAGRARRRNAAKTKRSASTLGFSNPAEQPSRPAGQSLPKMKQIGSNTYAHSVGRRKDNFAVPLPAETRSVKHRLMPEEDVSERDGATMNTNGTREDGGGVGDDGCGRVSLTFAGDDRDFAPSTADGEAREGGESTAPSRPPEGCAAARTTWSCGTEASAAPVPLSAVSHGALSERSLTLLERTPLSLFNRHWMASKGADLLLPYLSREVQNSGGSRADFERELGARRERKAKEEQRQSELDTQKAIRAYKRAERQFTMRPDLLKETEYQERLEAAEREAVGAKEAFHTLHERLKWKDVLSIQEETTLGHLRQEMDSAEQRLEAEAIEFELRLHRAFVEKAKNEQEQLRGQKARRHASIQEQVLKALDTDFFFSGGAGPEPDAYFLSNRMRAAAVQHAKRHSKDFVVALYHCSMALQELGEHTAERPLASFGVGDAVEYAGEWAEGGPEGVGVETARGGVVYEGQWLNGRRHGLGALDHTGLKIVYEGTWWDGKRHGYGVEVHYLHGSEAERLPVAFVEYEHGSRVGCKRFDPARSVEPLMLESVRRVCREAREAAGAGRGGHRVQVSHEEGDESGDDGKDKTPRKDAVARAVNAKRMERRRRETRRLEHEAKKQDIGVQRKELSAIEGSVTAALRELQDSEDRNFHAMSTSLGKVGLKSGRLYSMTEQERSRELSPGGQPSEASMRSYLQRKAVPDVLVDRIVSVYFTKFDGKHHTQADEDADRRWKEQAILFELTAGNGTAWHTFDIEKRLSSYRKRPKQGEAERNMHHARDKMKAAFSLPGVARAALSLPVNAGGGRRRAPTLTDLTTAAAPSKEQEIQDAMRRLMNGNENEPEVITVPSDMPLEAAVHAFNKDKYDYILVRPGTHACHATIEVSKEIHVMGEIGAKIEGRWEFKAGDSVSTLHNLTLQYEADTANTDYQRVLHVASGEVHITDSALLCPRGYCLWTSDRSAVSAKGCIFAGSEDGTVRAAAGAAVMEFSRCTLADSRLENFEESCVFADNDAEASMDNCVLQCADVGMMLTDRARAAVVKCAMRMFRRGCFGQMRPSETDLSLRESTTHGELWGLGDKPARFVKFANKHLDQYQPPGSAVPFARQHNSH